jgi:hypothetical protein
MFYKYKRDTGRRVVDKHHLDADPDSTYHPNADPGSDLFDADPDPTFPP